MVASLQSPDNGYSRERLGAYGLATSGWDLLPVCNPRSQSVAAGESAATSLADDVQPLWNGQQPETLDAWVALGRQVFFGFPLRAEPALASALGAPDRAAAFGVEHTDDGTYPGVLRFQDVDGTTQIGIACALCHSTVRDGQLVVGAARRGFDLGGLLVWHGEVAHQPMDAAMAARLGRWGPGRADITLDRDEDPVAIPDLWGLQEQSALTQGATIRHTGPVALAMRQETQLIETNHQRIRPPRPLAWALALYLYSLSPPARSTVVEGDDVSNGQAIFQATCQRCHDNPVGGGPPVPAALVGTDPALASGAARGTGLYRPPALIDLQHAAPYLHHGAIATLTELLTADRLRPDYQGGVRGPGPVVGHQYGFALSSSERTALEHYLVSR
ncbi:MAG: hypothetical protein QOI66_3920 [Myxococcales bacterium]|nr:hypothetical protein [Myxococcales bacterium]